MKTIKNLLTLTLLLTFSLLHAQDFDVPKNVKYDNKEDYKLREKEILNCINWIENSPMNKNEDKRKEAYLFLIEWITGSPDVTIGINSNVLPFLDNKKNPDLLVIFMGGWTKFAIENPSNKSEIDGNVAGLRSVIKVYKMGNGIKKDKDIEKLIKLDEKGDLAKWVKEQLTKKAK